MGYVTDPKACHRNTEGTNSRIGGLARSHALLTINPVTALMTLHNTEGMRSRTNGLATLSQMSVRFFFGRIYTWDAICSHACSLEALA
jgi:hypothetical protein